MRQGPQRLAFLGATEPGRGVRAQRSQARGQQGRGVQPAGGTPAGRKRKGAGQRSHVQRRLLVPAGLDGLGERCNDLVRGQPLGRSVSTRRRVGDAALGDGAQRFQGRQRFGGSVGTCTGMLRQQPPQPSLEPVGDVDARSELGDRPSQLVPQDGERVGPPEHHVSGSQLPQRRAQAVQVGPGTHRVSTNQLGSHVRRGPIAAGAHAHRRDRDAEVGQPQSVDGVVGATMPPSAPPDQHVGGLQVPVNDAVSVGVSQGSQQPDGRVPQSWPGDDAQLGQGSGAQLHGDERTGRAVGGRFSDDTQIEHVDDAGVCERGDQVRFAQEGVAEPGRGGCLGGEELERDDALAAGVLGTPDLSQGSATQDGLQGEGSQLDVRHRGSLPNELGSGARRGDGPVRH